MDLASVISTFLGVNSLPLCEPSQNGWPFDLPHAHHQYVPGSIFNTYGDFCAIVGSIMGKNNRALKKRKSSCP